MKKLIILAGLPVIVAGLFAFLPKAEEPAGYMMVTAYTELKGLGGAVGYVVTVGPDGQIVKKDEVPIKSLSQAPIELRIAQLPRINELRRQGWTIKESDQGTVFLEKL